MASFNKLFTGRFHLFPNAFFEIFLNDSESMFLMMYLIRKCNERNYYETLFKDKSFDVSLYDIKTNLYKDTVKFKDIMKTLECLQSNNLIKIISVFDNYAVQILINFDYINECNQKKKIEIDDLDTEIKLLN